MKSLKMKNAYVSYDMQEELLPAIDQYPQDSKEWIKDKYKKIEDNTKQKIDKWF